MDADPDIMVFAKGIASGFPMAGIATKADMFQSLKPGSIGGTYSGNTLGCAAACATIDAIKEDNMLDNATQRGRQLVEVNSLFLQPQISLLRDAGFCFIAEIIEIQRVISMLQNLSVQRSPDSHAFMFEILY